MGTTEGPDTSPCLSCRICLAKPRRYSLIVRLYWSGEANCYERRAGSAALGAEPAQYSESCRFRCGDELQPSAEYCLRGERSRRARQFSAGLLQANSAAAQMEGTPRQGLYRLAVSSSEARSHTPRTRVREQLRCAAHEHLLLPGNSTPRFCLLAARNRTRHSSCIRLQTENPPEEWSRGSKRNGPEARQPVDRSQVDGRRFPKRTGRHGVSLPRSRDRIRCGSTAQE
jgi:hypothetical protein